MTRTEILEHIKFRASGIRQATNYSYRDFYNDIMEMYGSEVNKLIIPCVISNEMEVCDCEIPKPIDPFHEIDKQVCKDCSGLIEQTYL